MATTDQELNIRATKRRNIDVYVEKEEVITVISEEQLVEMIMANKFGAANTVFKTYKKARKANKLLKFLVEIFNNKAIIHWKNKAAKLNKDGRQALIAIKGHKHKAIFKEFFKKTRKPIKPQTIALTHCNKVINNTLKSIAKPLKILSIVFMTGEVLLDETLSEIGKSVHIFSGVTKTILATVTSAAIIAALKPMLVAGAVKAASIGGATFLAATAAPAIIGIFLASAVMYGFNELDKAFHITEKITAILEETWKNIKESEAVRTINYWNSTEGAIQFIKSFQNRHLGF